MNDLIRPTLYGSLHRVWPVNPGAGVPERPDVNGDLLGRPKDVVAKCETVWFVQRITGVDWSSASFPKPGCGKGAEQQQQADHSGEHRQHADAADHAGITNPHAQPALAAKHA